MAFIGQGRGQALGPLRPRVIKTAEGADAMIQAHYVLTKANASLTDSRLHPNTGAPNYNVVHNHSDLDDMPSATNTDHDGRYYTEDEIDAMLAAAFVQINTLLGDNYVPYSGANADVDLGTYDFETTGFLKSGEFKLTIIQAKEAYDHIAEDGDSHGFIDQDVTSGSSPTFEDVTAMSVLPSNQMFTPYGYGTIGMPVVKMVVNVSNLANYYYRDLTSVANYTIQAGDYLVYSVRMEDEDMTAGVDFTYTDASFLRSTDAEDQNGLKSHPSTDHSEYSTERWYQRVIEIPAGEVGKIVSYFDFAIKGLVTGSRTAYFSNVMITDQYGNVRKVIYAGGETITTAAHISSNSTFTSMANTKELFLENFGITGPGMWGEEASAIVKKAVIYPGLEIRNDDGIYTYGSASLAISGCGGDADNYSTLSLRDTASPAHIWAFKHLDAGHEYSMAYYNGTAWTYPHSIEPDGDANWGTGSSGFGVVNDLGAQFNIENDVTTDIVLLVRAVASQSANGFEYQNSGGTALAKIESTGVIQAAGYKSSDASAGVTTTFTNGDAATVTVKNGIITAIA